jgi:hypothetical protein
MTARGHRGVFQDIHQLLSIGIVNSYADRRFGWDLKFKAQRACAWIRINSAMNRGFFVIAYAHGVGMGRENDIIHPGTVLAVAYINILLIDP